MYSPWRRGKLYIVLFIISLLMRQTEFLLQFSKQQQSAHNNTVTGTFTKLWLDAISTFFPNDNNNNTEATENLRNKSEEDENDGPLFGACLQVMDENHRLPEWLAYHYYMLPLRHLVLYVDPRSETSPMDIVNRWRPYLTIDVWNMSFIESQIEDSTALRKGEKIFSNRSIHGTSEAAALTMKHKFIQSRFYVVCSMYLRQTLGLQRQQQDTTQSNNTSAIPPVWVALHDVDEYMYLDPEIVDGAKERMSKPESIRTFIQEMAQEAAKELAQEAAANHNTTIMERENERNDTATKRREFATDSFINRCLMMARSYYGTTETSYNQTTNSIRDEIPEFINASDFETLRFRYRAPNADPINGPGKNLLLFGHHPGISSKEIFRFQLHTVHGSFKQCRSRNYYDNFSPIRIRHYLGSWEAYTSRLDARIGIFRSREHFLSRSKIGKNLPPDNAVEPWMQGFCRQFRLNQSLIQHLLQGAGKLPPQSKAIRQSNWSLTPERMRYFMNRGDLFSKWLKQRYEIIHQPSSETTSEGGSVMVVKVKNPNETEPYPYSFPPLD